LFKMNDAALAARRAMYSFSKAIRRHRDIL
jgi:hypothetical protein